MKKESLYFLAITFVLTYVFLFVLAFTPLHVDSTSGFILLFLGGSAPTIVAFFLVHRGNKVFKQTFYRNLGRFRVKFRWYVTVFLLPLAIGIGVMTTTKGMTVDPSMLSIFPLFVLNGILFGGLEEVGWRGFLQEKGDVRSILVFGVLFGILWGLWHLPMFFVEGLSHYDYRLIPFLLQGIVYSLWITWIYARTKSVPLVVFFHAMINATAALGLSLDYRYSYETFLYLGGVLAITVSTLYIANMKTDNDTHA